MATETEVPLFTVTQVPPARLAQLEESRRREEEMLAAMTPEEKADLEREDRERRAQGGEW